MFSKSKIMAVIAGVAASIVVLTGQPASAAVNQTYGFERGMSGWHVGYSGAGAYEITRTASHSYSGQFSLECILDGTNGTGTVWLTRSYYVPMDTLVSLDLTFQLWSESASAVNNFEVVAYIGTQPPSAKADFEVIGYADTVAGWQEYRFQRLQLTGQWPARVWVAFGISSTWEYSREYYMDHVTVLLTP